MHNRFCGDIGARASSVFHNELLTEPLGKPLSDKPGGDVGRTASGKADNDVHWARWVSLRPGNARCSGERDGASRQMQELTAG